MSKRASKSVYVLGTAARGGIRSVIEAYQACGFYRSTGSVVLHTHVEGGVFARTSVATQALCQLMVALARGRVAALHLHASMRGSFWRKAIFSTLARIFRVKVILHLHGSEFANYYCGASSITQSVIRYVFSHANKVVVLSKSWQDFLLRELGVSAAVVSNFVPDQFDAISADCARVRDSFLFLGQFGQRKGIFDLLHAFDLVRKEIPTASLFCGGNGQVEEVQELVDSLGLHENVHVLGWVSGDQKANLLHGCSTFVLPSYNEGLPMAIIEAMSHGMAIVSTNVGGIPELVDQENGTLVSPGDIVGLSVALLKFARRSQEAQGFGEASRDKYIRKFSPEACIRAMDEVYMSIGVCR